MAERQLKQYEAKAKDVRSDIVKVCANPAIYEAEVMVHLLYVLLARCIIFLPKHDVLGSQ